MNAPDPAVEGRARGIADHLALALARRWCRQRPLEPRLVTSHAGARVSISFMVDGSTEIDQVTSRLGELVSELRTLAPCGR